VGSPEGEGAGEKKGKSQNRQPPPAGGPEKLETKKEERAVQAGSELGKRGGKG